jgi:obg-like ATPase 1
MDPASKSSLTTGEKMQVGLANVGKSTLFQAITKSNLGNPAV